LARVLALLASVSLLSLGAGHAAAIDPTLEIDCHIVPDLCDCPVRDSWCKWIDCLVKEARRIVRETTGTSFGFTAAFVAVDGGAISEGSSCGIPNEPPV
jgi:hypothetical protein